MATYTLKEYTAYEGLTIWFDKSEHGMPRNDVRATQV